MSGVRKIRVRQAGPDHQVVTVQGARAADDRYCKRPCPDCPWRIDAVGKWPADAFRASAETAYDMASHTFACHSAGADKPRLCAGFLLRGADHNLTVRLDRMRNRQRDDVEDGGHALHASYADMAIANGVPADDPVLAPCRAPRGREHSLARERAGRE
ncbi:DUF6283 family protein [Stenotrophomonas maltophilia]|uniref:DUF6283 family protein n=1 Tax=Stenotrophomonas maltophilia TaxID=40324 RepID=UPI00244B6A1B|nr:DUF6283 family protein [Stenotrophomonas maltophilia]MDH0071275.1 DUF6283 family protein [Stenotrophomonas maltophilia]MDH0104128.1 DUF6283 family protein [Stenotrophomonas maltophilia]MDH0330223.1 DUF6283 family protein [Stenotrophomonas maltophilia]